MENDKNLTFTVDEEEISLICYALGYTIGLDKGRPTDLGETKIKNLLVKLTEVCKKEQHSAFAKKQQPGSRLN